MNYKMIHRLNTTGLVFAFLSAFGVTVVGKLWFLSKTFLYFKIILQNTIGNFQVSCLF